MMNTMFTPDQIAAMSAEIDAQLQELTHHATAKEGALRSGDADNEASCGNDTVIGAKDRRAEPADT